MRQGQEKIGRRGNDGPPPEHKSIIFSWHGQEFHDLLRSCDKDETTPYILKYLPKYGKIVEGGCGLGRYVKYLADLGYDIEGVEYKPETVRAVQRCSPGLPVIQGNILALPYRDGSISGLISLGVLEHFREGMEEPLREIRRVLKPGGILVISVPSQNRIRRIKKRFFLVELNRYLNPLSVARRSRVIRAFRWVRRHSVLRFGLVIFDTIRATRPGLVGIVSYSRAATDACCSTRCCI